MRKLIILPGINYPISAKQLNTEKELCIFSKTELDAYASALVKCAKELGRFNFSKEEFSTFVKDKKDYFFFRSTRNCRIYDAELYDGMCYRRMLYTDGENLFLTHHLISTVMEKHSAGNITFEHIELDSEPEKTEVERSSPQRFAELCSLYNMAKETGTYGPFPKTGYSEAIKIPRFINEVNGELYITDTLLMYLFRDYPAQKYVSVIPKITEFGLDLHLAGQLSDVPYYENLLSKLKFDIDKDKNVLDHVIDNIKTSIKVAMVTLNKKGETTYLGKMKNALNALNIYGTPSSCEAIKNFIADFDKKPASIILPKGEKDFLILTKNMETAPQDISEYQLIMNRIRQTM